MATKSKMMDLQTLADWPASKIRKEDGVIVGADMTQEWLLPWWWEHYRKHNSHKVAFVDLGMSLEMKEWCQERGEMIRLWIDDDFIKEQSQIDIAVVEEWNKAYGRDFWNARIAWFKKPFACLQTPFLRTLWIDLDCEIRGSIQSLFPYSDQAPGIAMAREQCVYRAPKGLVNLHSEKQSRIAAKRSVRGVPSPSGKNDGEDRKTPDSPNSSPNLSERGITSVDSPRFNSGVIAFRSNLDLIADWALFGIKNTKNYRSDDEVFGDLIEKRKISISEIPPPYNWSRCHIDQSKAIILHWHGTHGKEVLRSRIHLASLLS